MAAIFAATSVLDPGTQVGRFRVLRLLAQGGMAEVYQADQELTSGILRPAALKVIRPEFSESEDFREMFLDEARTACTLSHPNIVHIYEVGESDGLIYMGMEFVPGESLSKVARAVHDRGERFPDAALLAIGISTCSALEAVHALKLPGSGHLNLVHRDVSPHNLLLSSTGSLKLIDFGIAKAVTNRNLTNPGVTKGKAGYFSPEQAMGKLLDGRSDLFSLGITLYKLTAGITPFEGYDNHRDRNQALVAGRWEPLEKVAPGRVPGFYEVVRKSLQLRPDDRYANAGEMREALEAVALEGGVHVGPSALAGYVEEKNGQVSVATTLSRVSGLARASGSRPRLTPDKVPAVAPPLPAPVPAPASPPRPPRLFIALGVVGLLALAGGMGFLLRGRPPTPSPPSMTVTPSPILLPPPIPPDVTVVERPSLPEVPPPTSPRASAAALPHPPAHRTTAEPPRSRPKVAAKGEGELRIRSTPPGEVLVNGIKRGETPILLPLNSGSYDVHIYSPKQNLPGYCKAVRVIPHRTTTLIYDFSTEKCEVGQLDPLKNPVP